MMYGIRFNGKHSWNDLGITMGTEREIGHPSKMKIIKRPPFSNTDIDFSEIYGSQAYENRTLKYSFNTVDWFGKNTAEAMSTTKTVLANWLMNSNGKQPLYDDLYPNYYFLAEVEEGVSIEEDWNRGLLTVTFTAYPFMIHELPEGNDIWDTFNFELDVAQKTDFTMDGEYTFKGLPIGSTATIGAWATTYASGGGKIPLGNIGISGTITSMEYVESSRSKRAYEVSGIDGLVVEQDIIQAHIDPLEVTLINPGTPNVTPKMDLTSKTTIVKDNRSYNFVEGGNYTNDDFQLTSGENKLKIYSFHKNDISFEFHKELI